MVLKRHISIEFIRNMLVSALVIGFILFVGRSIRLVREGFDLFLLFQMALYVVPYILTFTIPISILTAAVLTYGRLAADNEVTTIRAAGINLWTTVTPLLYISLVAGFCTYHLADHILPKARFELLKMARTSAVHLLNNRIDAGERVIQFSDFLISFGRHDTATNRLHAVVIQKFKKGKLSQQVEAAWAKLPSVDTNNTISMDLYNGQMTSIERKGAPLYFDGFHFELDPMTEDGHINKGFKDMTSTELRELLKTNNVDPKKVNKIKYLIYNNTAMAFGCILFLVLGVPMGLVGKHGNRLVGFGFSLGIIFLLYYPLMLLFRSLGEANLLPALLCAWAPNILLGLLSAYLIKLVHN